MKALELKIPPPLIALCFGYMIWIVSLLTDKIIIPVDIKNLVTLFVLFVSLLIIFSAAVGFAKAKTTINPFKPELSSTLVTTGIYTLTRNPMYLSLMLLLCAWCIFLSNVYAVSLCIGFVVYMNRFQIIPEERVLSILFGKQYTAYKERVRRWL